MTRPVPVRALAVACALALALAPRAAAADDASPQRDAAKHFERAVALYAEADYQGALVEFKRAYATLPSPTVLYNIGETQYQAQDYAGALGTFTRYLAESPAAAPHRSEVEASLEVLRARVGRLAIVTLPAGADVAVDDVVVGRTPLAERLVVSVGRRKVTAFVAGRPPVVKYVEVAADDGESVTLEVPAGTADAPLALPASPPGASPASHVGGAWRTVGWVTAGMLAAGATASGVLALKASSDLANARNTFPVSAATLQADADHTRTYSLVADSLTVGAVVIGGVTLISALLSSSPSRAEARLRVAPASIDLGWTF